MVVFRAGRKGLCMAADHRKSDVVPNVVLYIDAKPGYVQQAGRVLALASRDIQFLALSLEEAEARLAKQELSGVRLVVIFLENARTDLEQATARASNLVHYLQRRRGQPALERWVCTKNSMASNALLHAGCQRGFFYRPSEQDLENVVRRLTAR